MDNLLKLIRERRATNRVCSKTGLPIFLGDGRYVLDGEHYHNSVDIDEIIIEHTDGVYRSADDLYSDDSDYYYYTEDEDEDAMLEDINENEFYYNENGNQIHPY